MQSQTIAKRNLGELICNILDPFVEEADKGRRTELKSTEVLCHEIKATNERISRDGAKKGPFQEAGNLVIGSKDVKAFYPNMDVELAAEEVKLEVEESDIDIEMDPTEAALFIACTLGCFSKDTLKENNKPNPVCYWGGPRENISRRRG